LKVQMYMYLSSNYTSELFEPFSNTPLTTALAVAASCVRSELGDMLKIPSSPPSGSASIKPTFSSFGFFLVNSFRAMLTGLLALYVSSLTRLSVNSVLSMKFLGSLPADGALLTDNAVLVMCRASSYCFFLILRSCTLLTNTRAVKSGTKLSLLRALSPR